ncbi:RHS repeat-associated core domain-containing protein [Archangium lipolyticum]|uniref:RHS repeat-associated core domain-containing protein n=1 Tax=Archangium lipolyticum TaxID=2970465 RepID=UPI002149D87D|nr:RHS repeat-associated core domain-containing protein [Archangium lipolyticum]
MNESIYSNAFNFGSYLTGGVDPRTGQYTASIQLVQLRPPNLNGLGRDIKLSFSALDTGSRCFGTGWSISLCSLDLANGRNVLTLSDGRSFRCGALPSKGQNLHFKDQKLKDFRVRRVDARTFDVINKDGVVERLVNAGESIARLSLLRFPNGETFQFHHDHKVNGVSYLTKVVFTQTQENYLKISYQGANAYTIDFPVDHGKTARILLGYQNDLLTSASLPYAASKNVGDGAALPRYTMSYLRLLGTFQVIEKLRNPTGAIELIQYKEQGHKVNGGGFIPHATVHTVNPGRDQPAIIKTYSFSQDQNFLGYESGKPEFVEGEDNLYLVQGNYTYKSTENILGSDGETPLSSTVRTFNKFHLLTKEVKTQQGTRLTTTITYNGDPSLAFNKQPANLHQPRTVVTRYEDLKASTSREETVETETDAHGNTLSTVEKTGVKTAYEYYPAAGVAGKCPADPFGFVRYVKRIIVSPAAGASGSATARTTEYTYQKTQTLGQVPASYYVNKATEVLDNGFSKTFSYNESLTQPATHGLLREFRSSLNGKTTIVAFTHEVKEGATTTTTTTTGFDGAKATHVTTSSRITSRRWRETDVNGVTTAFTYDVRGRLAAQTTSPDSPKKATRSYKYNDPRGDKEGQWPSLVETTPRGISKKFHYDGLGRVCSEEAQDDDRELESTAKGYQGTFRLVSEKSYDVLGQLVSEKRYDWWWNADKSARVATPTINETRYEYDGWGTLRRTRFADGHSELSIHDPVAMTLRKGIEGEGKTLTRFDLFDHPVTVTLLRADNAEYATTSYQYDGFGRKVSEKDPLGRTTRYSHDRFDRVTEKVLPNDNRVLIHYADFSASELVTGFTVDGTKFGERAYDGLGRVTSESVGGRTRRYGYQAGGDKPSQVTTPKGDVLKMKYAPHLGGKLVGLNGPDVQLSYTYDPKTSALLKAQCDGSTQELSYFASGLSRSASEQTRGRAGVLSQTSSYAYSMSGLIQDFADGFGNHHTSEYDDYGRLRSCKQGSRKASFTYDGAGRPATIRVEDTGAAVTLTTNLKYDDFGREVRRVTSGRSKRVLKTSYLDNGQISRRVTTVGGVIWRDETYAYDALGRLEVYQCAGSQPPRAAGGRKLRAQRFTFDKWNNITRLETTYAGGKDGKKVKEVTVYRYSTQEPTQLTAIERGGKSISLAYDAAGNLTRDERSQELRYDSQDRLVKVLDGAGKVLSEYHYDALGKLVRHSLPGGGEALRHYQGEFVRNQTLDDQRITYLGAEGQYFAQHEKQGSTSRGRLFATDGQRSLVKSLEVGSGKSEDFSYTPYGERSTSGEGESLIGFNGEGVDPVTGWYFLGNGYRVYNPTLMRFHSPDGWSPFGKGGLNPYLYCGSDPVNHADPTGHLSTSAWVGIGLGVLGVFVGVVSLGLGAGISAGMISGAGIIGGLAATNTLAVISAGVGVASSATGIAAAALEENEQTSAILGWVSAGLGIVSGVAGLYEVAKSAMSVGARAARMAQYQVTELGESVGMSASVLMNNIPRGEAINLGVAASGQAFGMASAVTGLASSAASAAGNKGAAEVLNWVSMGLGFGSVGVNAGVLGHKTRWAGAGSVASVDPLSGLATPTARRASDSEVALRSARPLIERSSFRGSSDRVINAYNNLPTTSNGMFRDAEIDIGSIFLSFS